MEKQLMAFAGTTAGSVVIALGVSVVALPYAMKYLIKNFEQQAIPWAYGFGKDFYNEYTETIKDALKKLEADKWHEANPDVTQQDLDIPEGIQNYFERVGLPASSHLVAFGDKESLSVFQHSGEWNYYGTRQINKQDYYLVVPKGIKVFIKIPKTESPDEYGLCRAGWTIKDGLCYGKEETFLLDSSIWP